MKTKESTLRGYMNFLGFLYITLEEKTKFNMSEACRVHQVNKNIPTLLKDRGILLNEDRGFWEWNYTYKPNPKMIESLLKELSNISNIQNKKRRKMEKTEFKSKIEEALERKREKNNSVESKVDSFLTELYNILSEGGNVNLNHLHEKHNTHPLLNKALKNLDIIYNYSGDKRSPHYGWISKQTPSYDLTNKVVEELRRLNRVNARKYSVNKNPNRVIQKEVKKSNRGGYRKGSGRKSKSVEIASALKITENKRFSILWGLFKYEVNK